MKRIFTLLGIGLMSFYGQSQTLDQSNTSSTGSGWLVDFGSYQSVGQSFIPGITGDLAEVVISLDANNGVYPIIAGNFTISILNGNGYGGTVVGTETFAITGSEVSGDYSIPITSTISLTSGNSYTYIIDEISGTGRIMINASSNTYAAGDLYYSVGSPTIDTGRDFKFKTFMNASCSIVDQTIVITDTELCPTNTGTTVTTASSEMGMYYYLRDNTNDTIIDGPIAGTGSGLIFNTNTLSNSMIYNVLASSNILDNNALSFDGVNDYVQTSTNLSITGAMPRTFEWWAKSNGNNDGYMISHGAAFNDQMWAIRDGAGTLQFHAYNNDINTGYVIDNAWHHYAVTYDGVNVLNIYADGVLVGTLNAGVLITATTPLRIGSYVNSSNNFDGSIDEVRVWNVERTISEINTNMSSELVGNESGLVSYYNFNQGIPEGNNITLDSLIDNTSNGNNGQLNNFTLTGTTSNWVNYSSTLCTLQLTNIVSVTVQDILAPVADNTTLADITATCEVTSLTDPTATDACSATVTVTNDATLPINTIGTTVVTWTYDDGNGNTSTQTQNVIVSDPNIDVTTATSGLTISANNTTATSYQWLDCGNSNAPISGETNATYTATVNGDYSVIITEGNCSDTSMCVQIAGVGIDELSNLAVEIYPNPNNGEFTISTTQNNVSITVYAIDGKIIVNQLQITETNQFINLGDIESGIYFVKVTNNTNQKTIRLVVE